MRLAPSIKQKSVTKLSWFAAFVAFGCLGAGVSADQGVSAEQGVYDSGWAVSGPVVRDQTGSVISPRRVPVEQLLPAGELERAVLPSRPMPKATAPRTGVPAAKPKAAAEPRVAIKPGRVAVKPGALQWRSRNSQPTAPRVAPRKAAPSPATPPVATPPMPDPADEPSAIEPAKPARSPEDISNAFALPGNPVPKAAPEDARTESSDDPAPPRSQEPAARSQKPTTQPEPPAEPTPSEPAADEPEAKAPAGDLREPAPFPGFAPEESAEESAEEVDEEANKPSETAGDEAAPPASNADPREPAALASPGDDAAPLTTLPAKRPTAPAKPEATENAKPAAPPADEPLVADEPEAAEAPKVAVKPAPRSEPADPEPIEPDQGQPEVEEPDTAEPESIADDEPAEPRPPLIGIAGAMRPAADARLPPLSRSQQYLRRRLRSVLSYYYRRPLTSANHDPWEVMHGMLAYGLHSRVLDSSARNKPVTAIGYLCFNKPCKRKRLMHLTPEGDIGADIAYGVQGHRAQFLAMLAQCNVSPDYPVRIADGEFTIRDIIEYEKRTCYTGDELTFKLIALAHYLDLDETWLADDGQTWSIPRLIEEERNQKIRGAACGGTHRLSGIALAARIRQARGQSLDGEYLEALRFTEEKQAYAFRLQNRDGSLSTEWFRGPGAEEDINRRVRTTGHILEWLLYSLPREELTSSRTVRAVSYLTGLLSSNTDNAWEIGPLSHALHALMLYDERVFQPHDNFSQMASNSQGNTRPQGNTRSQGNSKQRRPMTLTYQQIAGRVYGSYPSAEEAEEAREEAAKPQGLRALFGIGRSTRAGRSR